MIFQHGTGNGGGGQVEKVTVSFQPSMISYGAWCIFVNGEEVVCRQYGNGASFQMNKNSLLYVDDYYNVVVNGQCERMEIRPDGLSTEKTNCYFVFGDVSISR